MQTARKSLPSPESRQALFAAVRPDAWANHLALKVGGKKFTTKGREFIIPVMRDNSKETVIKKAAQMGFTIAMIIKLLHAVVEKKLHGLYLMPYKVGAIQFVQSRIDPIISSNEQLDDQFHRVQNFLHKQTNAGINFHICGTNVETDLREKSVDFEIWDERDKFVERYLTEALARMDGSEIARLVQLSTPTAPGHGVDSDENWGASDQRLWEIPCAHCGKFQILSMEENVKLGDSAKDSVMECAYCHKELTDNHRRNANAEGRWVPQHLNGEKTGYHISQFNSPTKRFQDLINGWFDGQSDSLILRGFYNNGLGLPYAGQGDKFTEEILDNAIISGHRLKTIPEGPLYVGVDVGNSLHVVTSYESRAKTRMLWDIRILTEHKNSEGNDAWDKLDKYLASLHAFVCVIDANPEKTRSKELSLKYPGQVWMGWERDRPNQAELAVFNPDRPRRGESGEVVIDRTMAFDQYIKDFQEGLYGLPANARELGEHHPKKNFNGFYSQHLEMARVVEVPEESNSVFDLKPHKPTVVRWKKTRNPDHFHHASMFQTIAFLRKPPMTIPKGIISAFNQAGSLVSNG